jgi:sterol desaturase/sphingolipid hydroxylase (fatty acid hydroxylase superfamily)
MVDYMVFIAKSFIFELIFDLFHYCAHRIFHAYPFLYRNIHKKHHEIVHPSAGTTFHMSIVDLLLGYSLPLLLCTQILNMSNYMSFSCLEFNLMTVYLTYQEVGGHMGKYMSPTSSFPQCIWLPKLLGIELYTEDHDLHHTKVKYNFSKRFKIWDRIFNTYKSPLQID